MVAEVLPSGTKPGVGEARRKNNHHVLPLSVTTGAVKKMAGVAGLEPVTSAVTGQRSNQLSYTPAMGRQKVGNPPRRVNREVGFQISGSSNRRQGGGGGEPR